MRLRRVKQLYGYKLRNYRKVKLLMGKVRRRTMIALLHRGIMTPGSHRAWKFISGMETRLDQLMLKMGIGEDILDAKWILDRDLVYLNGHRAHVKEGYQVQPGDVIGPNAANPAALKNHVARALLPLMDKVYNSY